LLHLEHDDHEYGGVNMIDSKSVIYGLYCTCHQEDGVRYIGQTSKSVQVRFNTHLAVAAGHHGKSWVINWVNKHGGENIRYMIVERCGPDDLNDREEYWIAWFRSIKDDMVNVRSGGKQSRGHKRPQSAIDAMTGPGNPMWGKKRPQYVIDALQAGRKPITEETRAKLRAAHTGRKVTPETLLIMSAAQKLAKNTPEYLAAASIRMSGKKNPMYGVKLSDDVKRKISMSSPKSKLNEEKVRQIRLRRKRGESMKELAREFNVDPSAISSVVSGRNWSWVK